MPSADGHQLGKLMSYSVNREPKAERLEVRLTPATKALLTQAAQTKHTTVTEFLISSAVKAAEETITSPKVFYANEDGWNELMEFLNEDDGQ
jgi:uncharacterized protein (DUF1778 family)